MTIGYYCAECGEEHGYSCPRGYPRYSETPSRTYVKCSVPADLKIGEKFEVVVNGMTFVVKRKK